MEFLQDIPWGTVLLITAGLCGIGIVLAIIVQVFGFVGNFLEIIFEVFNGGPLAWCGCLIGIFICGGCACTVAFAASVLSTCGTPNAVNFCVLLGR